MREEKEIQRRIKMNKWIDLKIEEPLKNLVRLLRLEGFNTTCSCGHYPTPNVEMECYSPVDVSRLYDLLVENNYINFEIIYRRSYYPKLGSFNQSLRLEFYVKHLLIKESDIKEKS